MPSSTAETTFDAVISTGAAVQRSGERPDGSWGMWGMWTELLDIAGADLSRMSGAPLLVDHLARTDFQVGVVEAARVEHGKLVATLRFGTSPQARQLKADVEGKIRRQLSVSYRTDEWSRSGAKGDTAPTFTAAKWQPLEVSLVAIGADAGARFRSSDHHHPDVRFRVMDTAEAAIPAVVTNSMITPDIIGLERARQSGIRAAARSVDLGDAPRSRPC